MYETSAFVNRAQGANVDVLRPQELVRIVKERYNAGPRHACSEHTDPTIVHLVPVAEALVVTTNSEDAQAFVIRTALCTILLSLSFATTMKLLVAVIEPSPN